MIQQSVAAVVAGAKIGPSETEEKEGGKALIAFLKVRNKWELLERREGEKEGGKAVEKGLTYCTFN